MGIEILTECAARMYNDSKTITEPMKKLLLGTETLGSQTQVDVEQQRLHNSMKHDIRMKKKREAVYLHDQFDLVTERVVELAQKKRSIHIAYHSPHIYMSMDLPSIKGHLEMP